MTPSPQLTTIFVGALAVLIGACLAFGHRYSDKSEKLAGSTAELNEIKSSMRFEITVPAIDRIWRYILQTDGAMRDEGFLFGSLDLKSGNILDVRLILFDTNRRGYFNMLINELERTFKESSNVNKLWLSLRSCFTRIAQELYLLAALAGFGGYGLLFLVFYPIPSLSVDEMNLLTTGLVILVLVILITIITTYQKAKSSLRDYEKDKSKYLDGITRVQ